MKTRALPTLLLLLLPLTACNSRPAASPASQPAAASPFHPAARNSSENLAARPRRARPSATPGFDFFLLNLSWSPEFCSTHPSAAECAQHRAFVLHGLWPQNTNGTYPENCTSAPGPANPSQYSDIYPDQSFLEHEWHTHGTCSGLAPDAFFQAARSAFHSVTVPPRLAGLKTVLMLPPGDILSLLTAANPSIPRSSLTLSCGSNFLTAVQVCLDKQLHPIACGPLRSCRATVVRIPPP
ncbi:MAG TPA: hypothetical protein VM865_06500, partial [Acidobacteriaceae bacterium]|nr:hypothetical protein [Acidobacteriaceae bacterium]